MAKDNSAAAAATNKFQRYRERRKQQGLKQIRLWVVDVEAPGFKEEARRQAMLLRGTPGEREALDFIEAAADWGDE